MIFENSNDEIELIENISKSILSNKKKPKEHQKSKTLSIDEIPLDEVLPPSVGHGIEGRAPNAHKGGFIEAVNCNLEGRLIKLFNEMVNASISTSTGADPTKQMQEKAIGSKVGMVGVLGHSKGDKEPSTAAAAYRAKIDPYAKRGKAKKEIEDAENPSNKLKDTLEKVSADET